jgi:hypothetical protein
MAKLSARGRTAIAEAVREHTAEQLQSTWERHNGGSLKYLCPDCFMHVESTQCSQPCTREGCNGVIEARPNLSLTIWERVSRRLMSDGTILEKRDVRFRPDARPYPSEENGRYYSYGWKVHGKVKVSAAEWVTFYRDGTERMRAEGRTSPWTVTVTGRL